MTRATRGLLGCSTALALAFVVSTIPGVRGHAGASGFWDDGIYNAQALLAAVVCALRGRRVRAERWAWWALAAGMGCSFVGNVYYSVVLAHRAEVPYRRWPTPPGWGSIR